MKNIQTDYEIVILKNGDEVTSSVIEELRISEGGSLGVGGGRRKFDVVRHFI